MSKCSNQKCLANYLLRSETTCAWRPNCGLNVVVFFASFTPKLPFIFFLAFTTPSDAPTIRSCTINKWVDFDGFGFNLHAEKGKPGHFIGIVDDNSPAEAAGLKQGDKIIAVNGDSVLQASHQELVSKIKSNPQSVRLLVLDPEAEEYYSSRDIVVTEDMPNVAVMASPDASPGSFKI